MMQEEFKKVTDKFAKDLAEVINPTKRELSNGEKIAELINEGTNKLKNRKND